MYTVSKFCIQNKKLKRKDWYISIIHKLFNLKNYFSRMINISNKSLTKKYATSNKFDLFKDEV